MQKNSLAELKETYKYALYEDVTTENRENYFRVSVKPITKTAEDDMELLSDIVTWGEEFIDIIGKLVYITKPTFHKIYFIQ